MTGCECRQSGHTHILWDSWHAGPVSLRRMIDAGTRPERGGLLWRACQGSPQKKRARFRPAQEEQPGQNYRQKARR